MCNSSTGSLRHINWVFCSFAWLAKWKVKWNRSSMSESVFISAVLKEEIQGNESLYVSKRKGGGGEKAKIAGQETKNANFAKKNKNMAPRCKSGRSFLSIYYLHNCCVSARGKEKRHEQTTTCFPFPASVAQKKSPSTLFTYGEAIRS